MIEIRRVLKGIRRVLRRVGWIGVAIVYLVLAGFAQANSPEKWLSPQDPGQGSLTTERESRVRPSSYHEVKVTSMLTALERLNKTSAILLSPRQVVYFVGHEMKPPRGTKPYLVRGLFCNYTGSHTIFFKGERLLVRHESLGRVFKPEFCPLVIYLPSKPLIVHVEVGGAR